MNYRHAYHAGNFADCMKHAVLCWVLGALTQKAAPLLVLDTHAGTGHTDLTGPEAERTGEWRAGIGRLLDDPPEPLRPYVETMQRLGLYPGSPRISRSFLRPGDKLLLCERHPEDCRALRANFRGDAQTAVHERDGYEAIGGLLNGGIKRGLVLIDPPFEQGGEFDRVAAALQTGCARFPGTFMVWYPIKGRRPVRAFHQAVQATGLRDVVALELYLREPTDATRLNGSGLLLRHPPFGLLDQAPAMLAALLARLGNGEEGEGTMISRLTDE